MPTVRPGSLWTVPPELAPAPEPNEPKPERAAFGNEVDPAERWPTPALGGGRVGEEEEEEDDKVCGWGWDCERGSMGEGAPMIGRAGI
jgi:hypothetical protein